MCLYSLSSCTLQDTSKVWHLLLGGRLINTTDEHITVKMCVMFCQKIQIWFQHNFRRLLASNIRSRKPQKEEVESEVCLYRRFFGDDSAEMKVSESTAGMSSCPASGTHYKWYASATHPLRRWLSATVPWRGADAPSKVGIPVKKTSWGPSLLLDLAFNISRASGFPSDFCWKTGKHFFVDWCFLAVLIDMKDMRCRKIIM